MRFGSNKIFSIFQRNKAKGKNIILTGIPRSGTTLTCKLLCEFPDVIALNEPLKRELFPSPRHAVNEIEAHFHVFRHSLLTEGKALARTNKGMVTDNAFSTQSADRARQVVRTSVFFEKKLKSDFTLVMKHCAEFTLILPLLTAEYTCYAVIRNPLAVLGSWRSVDIPVSRGKVAKSQRLLPSFHQQYNEIKDLTERQLFILSWYFGQFRDLPKEQIIRYEGLVTNPIEVLAPFSQSILPHQNQLKNKNTNSLYDRDTIKKIGEKLLQSEGNYWHFYPKSAVEHMLDQLS